MSEPTIRRDWATYVLDMGAIDIDWSEWLRPGVMITISELPKTKQTQWTVSEFEQMIAGEGE